MTAITPTLLLILDGWGYAPASEGNAVSLANTPNIDRVLAEYPSTHLLCSGRAVGLPDGFMGNSEVGHMNIGAGRVIYQDMTRIDIAVEDESFYDNETLDKLLTDVKAKGGRLHCMGLVSDGGVHSHVRHLHAVVKMAKKKGVELFIHAFMDGRDTPPTSGLGYIQDLEKELGSIGHGTIATVSGRYYAMDRDKRWERNELAYKALIQGQGQAEAKSAEQAMQQAYDAGENDEFVKPCVIVNDAGAPLAKIEDNDGIFFFNFRADRARQISRAIFDADFSEFPREIVPKLAGFATMTEYESSFGLPVAFPPVSVSNTLGQKVSELGLKQLRIAETEKYAHVTYFFNCGQEDPFPNEDRELVQSPRDVATYDLKPEMSVYEVTEKFLNKWNTTDYALVVCNLANLDMVGHTGIIPAAIKACEAVDACVGRILEAVLAKDGRVLMTADHGNAEEMIAEDGQPQTAHSKNPVSLVLISKDKTDAQLRPGVLGDIAPTILKLWGVEPPEDMNDGLMATDEEKA